MAMEAICDGCGKRAPAISTRDGRWFKPYLWFERTDDDGTQTACSRECIDKIAEKAEKTNVILPI